MTRLAKARGILEEHEHIQVSGPRHNVCDAHGRLPHVKHAHVGGDRPHRHPDYGPASYVIDKDEWFRSTGLRGGGRKVFHAEPTGRQLPIEEMDPGELEFDVIVDEESCRKFIDAADGEVTGSGMGPAARMALGHRLTANVMGVAEYERRRGPRSAK